MLSAPPVMQLSTVCIPIYTPFLYAVLDAMGKPPPAILDGAFHWSGSWELCKQLHVNYSYYNHTYMESGIFVEVRQFKGEYARISFRRIAVSYAL